MNAILYYPTIGFQKSDYQWLWTAALLWDKIYRIIPSGLEFHEPDNIRALCESKDIGTAIFPEQYAKAASQGFKEYIDENNLNLSGGRGTGKGNNNRIHRDKMDMMVMDELLNKAGYTRKDNEWIELDSEFATSYMTFLAKHIAAENHLSLYTGDENMWGISARILYENKSSPETLIEKEQTMSYPEALALLKIPDLFPAEILNIPPPKILEFRKRRTDQRGQLIEALNDYRTRLSQVSAAELREGIVREEKERLEEAIKEYRKSMDILNIAKFTGVLTTLLPLIKGTLDYLEVPTPSLTPVIISASGVALTALSKHAIGKVHSRLNNPYTYLANITSSFDHYLRQGIPMM